MFVRVENTVLGVQEVRNPSGLVASNGNFFLFSAQQITSSWEGLYFFDSETVSAHKFLHAVLPQTPSSRLVATSQAVFRSSESFSEKMFFQESTWMYEARGEGGVEFFLDAREANDYDTQGRFHTVTALGRFIFRIDTKDESFFLRSNTPLQELDEWVEHSTSFDASRGQGSSWWSHKRIRFFCSGVLRVAIARSYEELVRVDWGVVLSERSDTFFLVSSQLEELTVSTSFGPAVLAGFPWFTQVWSRDEAIALGGLFVQERFAVAKEILLRQVLRVGEDGRIANRTPGAALGCADGVGWVFTRLHELVVKQPGLFSQEELRVCYDQLCLSLTRLQKNYFRDGLVFSAAQETWMDTEGFTGDTREGFCIEIQALTLRMFSAAEFFSSLLGEPRGFWSSQQQELRVRVREEFFVDEKLCDQAGVVLARPNAFIAAYVYPQLLSVGEWRGVFSWLIDRLWLSWGGFATIDVDNELFCLEHAGVSDVSYHRGDSWYWLNALAGVVLSSHEQFRVYAQEVVSSCERELSCLGVVGRLSEISSASEQVAFGCFSQAWSASMLLELLSCLEE